MTIKQFSAYGIFSPKDELEAVELSFSQAEVVASNLSQADPGSSKVKPTNRNIREVTIVDEEFLQNTLLAGAELLYGKAMQLWAMERDKELAILNSSNAAHSSPPNNYWEPTKAAHRRAQMIGAFIEALKELK